MYVSLYRKYRPRFFRELVGQEPIATTLSRQVAEGRVAHAYLFAGPRGTGKTSAARILARAVNCERGPAPEPCGECPSCVAVAEGSSLDVVEIDAASHGHVEDARDLREKAFHAPASSRAKFYILDEAHMLSGAAFDALLKIMEEPPAHVFFVLATTAPQKVPATVAGRCQRFDFRRIPSAAVVARLEEVARAEGYEVETSALRLIARHAAGSLRDALASLEQAAAYGGGRVDLEVARRLLGEPSSDLLGEFMSSLAARDLASLLGVVARAAADGWDLRVLARAMVGRLRQVFLASLAPSALADLPQEEREEAEREAASFEPGFLARALELLARAEQGMGRAQDPRLSLELALARAALPELDDSPPALLARVERIERRLGFLAPERVREGSASLSGHEEGRVSGSGERTVPAAREAAASGPAGAGGGDSLPLPSLHEVKQVWPEVLEAAKRRRRVTHVHLLQASPAAVEGGRLVLEVPGDRMFHAEELARAEHMATLKAALEEVLGFAPEITFRPGPPAGRRRPRQAEAPEVREAGPERERGVSEENSSGRAAAGPAGEGAEGRGAGQKDVVADGVGSERRGKPVDPLELLVRGLGARPVEEE